MLQRDMGPPLIGSSLSEFRPTLHLGTSLSLRSSLRCPCLQTMTRAAGTWTPCSSDQVHGSLKPPRAQVSSSPGNWKDPAGSSCRSFQNKTDCAHAVTHTQHVSESRAGPGPHSSHSALISFPLNSKSVGVRHPTG